jgi:nitrile hydratase subunit alpha
VSADHDHDHHHEYRPSEISLRVKAIESLLIEKKLLDPVAVDQLVDAYENKIGPHNGARVVAKAWADPEFKKRLLGDGTKAIQELGYSGVQGEDMVVVENTPEVHNMVVCTLCSCYPWPTLGLPPNWYKAPPYRSRAVIDPRGVLKEFGVEFRRTSRCASGIATRSFGTSFFRSGRPAPRDSARTNSPSLSPATA